MYKFGTIEDKKIGLVNQKKMLLEKLSVIGLEKDIFKFVVYILMLSLINFF